VRSPDTSAEARDLQVAAWRALSPQERVELAARMSEAMMAVSRAGIRHRHPDLGEDDVTHELLRRLRLGR
jgi:hypothetical protein